jgi:hypothetical protein
MSACRRMQIDPYLSPCTKQVQEDQRLQHKTRYTLIKEKVGNSLGQVGTGDNFLSRISIAQALRSTVDNWNLRKLKSFCKAKATITRTKGRPADGEKILTNLTSNRGLMSKIHKELKKLDHNKPNNPI